MTRKRLTTRDIAEMIGYNQSTIRRWHKAGKMPTPAPPPHHQTEWWADDIKKWINDNFETE